MTATDPTPAAGATQKRARGEGGKEAARPKTATTYFCIDLPRGGGAWLQGALSDHYPASELAWIYEANGRPGSMSVEAFQKLPDEARDRIRAVMGYFNYGLHRRPGPWFSYLTVMREPLERVLLLQRDYVALVRRSGGRARADGRPRADSISLESFVFGQQHLAADNGFVRAIAGRRHVRFGRCGDDLYDEAIEHVERRFSAILLAEEPVRSRAIVSRVIGAEPAAAEPASVELAAGELAAGEPASDEDPASIDAEPGLVQRIRELNRLDVRLYDYARERFDKTYQKLVG